MRYPTIQQRPFEAEGLPCAYCHAPLPVDPLAPVAYCPHCGGATLVPETVRARAVQYQQWLSEARHLAQSGDARAQASQQAVVQQQAMSALSIAMIAMTAVPTALWAVGYAAYGCVQVLLAVTRILLGDILTDASLGLVNFVVVVFSFLVILVALLAGFWWWRRHQHRKRVNRAVQAGHVPGSAFASYQQRTQGSATGVCSVCGAPVEFRVGEQQVRCAYCGSTVMPGPAQQRGLAVLAFRDASHAMDLANWRAARAQLRAARGTQNYYFIYLAMAMGGCMVIPVVIVGAVIVFFVRALTRGVEDAIDEFAVSVQGGMERGLELPFDWLDTYWPAKAPASAEHVGGPFTLRWSAHTVYGGRPVLVSACSNWLDRVGERVVILMAHPERRSAASIARGLSSAAAVEANRAGYRVAVDDAGVVLEGSNVPGARLTTPSLHHLLGCAYGVAGASAP